MGPRMFGQCWAAQVESPTPQSFVLHGIGQRGAVWAVVFNGRGKKILPPKKNFYKKAYTRLAQSVQSGKIPAGHGADRTKVLPNGNCPNGASRASEEKQG